MTRVTAQGTFPEDEVLLLAASAERYSEHPLGKAIVEAARERGLALDPANEFSAQAGHGVRARVAGHEVLVRRPGATVTIDGAADMIEIADTIKPEAEEAVRRLRDMGIEVWMIAGNRAASGNRAGRLFDCALSHAIKL
ncbi:MAG: HAD family hydrolase [Candidatus Solibacter sp.]|nr:HAD family hydrolase [Candidatus Solibacter sp.]